jgi:hypothetical protein
MRVPPFVSQSERHTCAVKCQDAPEPESMFGCGPAEGISPDRLGSPLGYPAAIRSCGQASSRINSLVVGASGNAGSAGQYSVRPPLRNRGPQLVVLHVAPRGTAHARWRHTTTARSWALPLRRHRMVLNFQGEAEGVRLEQVLAPMLAKTI